MAAALGRLRTTEIEEIALVPNSLLLQGYIRLRVRTHIGRKGLIF